MAVALLYTDSPFKGSLQGFNKDESSLPSEFSETASSLKVFGTPTSGTFGRVWFCSEDQFGGGRMAVASGWAVPDLSQYSLWGFWDWNDAIQSISFTFLAYDGMAHYIPPLRRDELDEEGQRWYDEHAAALERWAGWFDQMLTEGVVRRLTPDEVAELERKHGTGSREGASLGGE